MLYSQFVWIRVLAILFGAGFTVAVAIALGTLLLARLRVALFRGEAALIAFVTGSAALSLAVFLLSVVHQARRGVFLAGGSAAILGALRAAAPKRTWLPVQHDAEREAHPQRATEREADPQRARSAWPVLFLLILVTFSAVYFFNALAPEVSPDGSGYHLGNVVRYWRAHGFDWRHESMYSAMPQGVEMLFLVAFGFGGYSSAALVHCAFLIALPLLIACYGLRIGAPRAAWFAGIVAFTCPVAGLAGSSAYNDLAVVTVVFAVFHLLQVWSEVRSGNVLLLIGLLCGFAFSVKYTAAMALPFALAFVPWRSWLRVLAPAALMALPWLLRNWLWMGNPLAPFLNGWFPNPHFHLGMEQSYLADLRHYEGIAHFWEIPLQLAFRGGKIPGILGPVFLLAPFALLALRSRYGRRLLLAALVFGLPAYFNTHARFLLAAVPFLSLALGLALQNSWGVLPALAAFQALACWPSVLSLYCDPLAWRLRTIPVRAALRLEPETDFLRRQLRDYPLKQAIEQAVPPGERVFSFAGRAEAYIDRDIVVGYESAFGNRLQDALMTLVNRPPVDRQRFRFPAVTSKGLRVVETAAGEEYWTIAEMRLFAGGRELARSPVWRFTAWPNRWEAALAFDGNPSTRWSTWQAMPAGSRWEAAFPRPETVDEVVLECAAVGGSRVRVEYLAENGQWIRLLQPPEEFRAPPPPGLRLDSTSAVKAAGIRFLLVDDADFTAGDMKQNANLWGLTELAEANGIHLYRID